jgi:hypothetical protein
MPEVFHLRRPGGCGSAGTMRRLAPMSSGGVVDAEAIEEPVSDEGEPLSETEVRALPQRRTTTELTTWRGEVRAIAVVAAGGLAAGAATVAAVSAAKAVSGGRAGRSVRRRKNDRDIVATRSFLVDVHLLGR